MPSVTVGMMMFKMGMVSYKSDVKLNERPEHEEAHESEIEDLASGRPIQGIIRVGTRGGE